MSERDFNENQEQSEDVFVEDNEQEYEEQPEQGQAEEQAPELSAEEEQLFDDGGLAAEPEAEQRRPKKRKKDTRDLYAAIERERLEKIRLAQEYAALQRQLQEKDLAYQQASEAANFNFESSVDLRIKAAERALIEAEEIGDAQAKAKAINELQQANIAKSKSEDWKFQQEVRKQQEQQAEPESQEFLPNPAEIYRESIQEFDDYNLFWSDPRSPDYNETLVRNMPGFVMQFNQDLVQNGLAHMIGTNDYLQVLQSKIDEAVSASQGQPQYRNQPQSRRPQMRQVSGGGAPIRGSNSGARRPVQKSLLDTKPELARDANQILEGLRKAGYNVKSSDFRKGFEQSRAERRAKQGL